MLQTCVPVGDKNHFFNWGIGGGGGGGTMLCVIISDVLLTREVQICDCNVWPSAQLDWYLTFLRLR